MSQDCSICQDEKHKYDTFITPKTLFRKLRKKINDYFGSEIFMRNDAIQHILNHNLEIKKEKLKSIKCNNNQEQVWIIQPSDSFIKQITIPDCNISEITFEIDGKKIFTQKREALNIINGNIYITCHCIPLFTNTQYYLYVKFYDVDKNVQPEITTFKCTYMQEILTNVDLRCLTNVQANFFIEYNGNKSCSHEFHRNVDVIYIYLKNPTLRSVKLFNHHGECYSEYCNFEKKFDKVQKNSVTYENFIIKISNTRLQKNHKIEIEGVNDDVYVYTYTYTSFGFNTY